MSAAAKTTIYCDLFKCVQIQHSTDNLPVSRKSIVFEVLPRLILLKDMFGTVQLDMPV